MGMYSLIADTQSNALAVANCWHESEAARELLAKIDAYTTLADRWYGEVPEVARAFTNAAEQLEDELDEMRGNAVNAAADAFSNDRQSDEWDDAWEKADNDAPPIRQIIQDAYRLHAGDGYLERFAA